jgi:GGDEF-like domain/PucR C-terminal helix-turn-helix domain
MEELWPAPPVEVADAIRSLCQRLLNRADELTGALTPTVLEAQKAQALAADAALALEDRHGSRADLVQWLTSNIQHPGRRVEPYFDSRTTAYIRDLASRGITPDYAGAWRAALSVCWRLWLKTSVEHISDPRVLVEVLDVTAHSLVQYAIDWMSALHEAGLAAAAGNVDADMVAMIQLIASGDATSQDLAEGRLNYRLARWHQAIVVWTNDPQEAQALEDAVAAFRAAPAGRNALVARASTSSRWIWLSGSSAPDLPHVEKVFAGFGDVQAAIGRPGYGLQGFRSSHQDALAAQAMIMRLGSDRRLTAYADVELIDALTRDYASAQRFVARTLGPLAEADQSLREALLTYVQCGFNTTRAAATIYAHRNTVERRVSRANELSTVKVEDNPAHVAAALLVLDIAPTLLAHA